MNTPYLFAFIAGCFVGLIYLAWPVEGYTIAEVEAVNQLAVADDDYLTKLTRSK